MHSARWRSSRSALNSAFSCEICSSAVSCPARAAIGSDSVNPDMHRLSATWGVRSPPQRDDAWVVLLADLRLIWRDHSRHVHTGDAALGTLPDCLGPSSNAML